MVCTTVNQLKHMYFVIHSKGPHHDQAGPTPPEAGPVAQGLARVLSPVACTESVRPPKCMCGYLRCCRTLLYFVRGQIDVPKGPNWATSVITDPLSLRPACS
jgi:hypothetical protein